jgi:hypothetical protein
MLPTQSAGPLTLFQVALVFMTEKENAWNGVSDSQGAAVAGHDAADRVEAEPEEALPQVTQNASAFVAPEKPVAEPALAADEHWGVEEKAPVTHEAMPQQSDLVSPAQSAKETRTQIASSAAGAKLSSPPQAASTVRISTTANLLTIGAFLMTAANALQERISSYGVERFSAKTVVASRSQISPATIPEKAQATLVDTNRIAQATPSVEPVTTPAQTDDKRTDLPVSALGAENASADGNVTVATALPAPSLSQIDLVATALKNMGANGLSAADSIASWADQLPSASRASASFNDDAGSRANASVATGDRPIISTPPATVIKDAPSQPENVAQTKADSSSASAPAHIEFARTGGNENDARAVLQPTVSWAMPAPKTEPGLAESVALAAAPIASQAAATNRETAQAVAAQAGRGAQNDVVIHDSANSAGNTSSVSMPAAPAGFVYRTIQTDILGVQQQGTGADSVSLSAASKPAAVSFDAVLAEHVPAADFASASLAEQGGVNAKAAAASAGDLKSVDTDVSNASNRPENVAQASGDATLSSLPAKEDSSRAALNVNSASAPATSTASSLEQASRLTETPIAQSGLVATPATISIPASASAPASVRNAQASQSADGDSIGDAAPTADGQSSSTSQTDSANPTTPDTAASGVADNAVKTPSETSFIAAVPDLAPAATVASSSVADQASIHAAVFVAPAVARNNSNESARDEGIGTEQPSDEAVAASAQVPLAAPLPSDENINAAVVQPVAKTALKEASSAAGLKSPAAASTAPSATSKSADQAEASNNIASHAAQQNGQPQQDSQSDRPQPAAVAPQAADHSPSQGTTQSQPQTAAAQVAVPVAAPETAAAHRAPDGAADTPRAMDQREASAQVNAEGSEDAAVSSISAAKLTQALNATEMRVGMHSVEFGDISIRTSVSQQELLAHISLDHSDLSQALAAHLSSVQTKLGDDSGLRTTIQIDQQGSAPSDGSGHSSPQEQRPFASSLRSESAASLAENDNNLNPANLAMASDGRLDIRA